MADSRWQITGETDWHILAVKRIFDLITSLLALIVLSPLMALIALAIKLNPTSSPTSTVRSRQKG